VFGETYAQLPNILPRELTSMFLDSEGNVDMTIRVVSYADPATQTYQVELYVVTPAITMRLTTVKYVNSQLYIDAKALYETLKFVFDSMGYTMPNWNQSNKEYVDILQAGKDAAGMFLKDTPPEILNMINNGDTFLEIANAFVAYYANAAQQAKIGGDPFMAINDPTSEELVFWGVTVPTQFKWIYDFAIAATVTYVPLHQELLDTLEGIYQGSGAVSVQNGWRKYSITNRNAENFVNKFFSEKENWKPLAWQYVQAVDSVEIPWGDGYHLISDKTPWRTASYFYADVDNIFNPQTKSSIIQGMNGWFGDANIKNIQLDFSYTIENNVFKQKLYANFAQFEIDEWTGTEGTIEVNSRVEVVRSIPVEEPTRLAQLSSLLLLINQSGVFGTFM
jgi:hypothetical protein